MEEKQLNFNQPILSVRRFPPTISIEKDEKRKTRKALPNASPLPSYISEQKSGPVRNPGTVPFVWEQTPGRPKDESHSQTHSPIITTPPPGRVLKANPSAPENVNQKQVVSSGEDGGFVDAHVTLEGPEVGHSGTFLMDPGTRDFMLGRFLPAGKAMVSENPQYSSWKQPVAHEKPRQLKKLTRSSILPNNPEDKRQEESDDEDGGFDEHGNLSTKVCGLTATFHLLNPVPVMSVQTRLPAFPASRTQTELTRDASNEKRSVRGARKIKPCECTDTLRNKSNQVRHQSYSLNLEGTSLYMRLQGSGVSLPENELCKSRFFEERRFLDESNGCRSPKSTNSVGELLANQTTERGMGLGLMIEKTLYEDSVHKAVKSNSFSLDGKGIPNSIRNDVEIVFRGLETPPIDPFLKDIQNTIVIDEKVLISQRKSSHPADSTVPSFSHKLDQEFGMEKPKVFVQDQYMYQKSIISANSELSRNVYLDFEDKQQLTKMENKGKSQAIDSKLPLPPPLPKSPSESWLWHTLPNASSRNLSSHLNLGKRMMSRH